MMTRRRFLQAAGGLLACGVGTAAYTVVVEPGFRLTVANWIVKHPHWPAEAPSLRIAIVTDIHAVEPWMPSSRIAHIAEVTNSLAPDLTVLLGDFVTGVGGRFRTGLVPIADWSEALSVLQAPLGIYAILGNHDWWVDADAVRTGLKRFCPVLENHALKLNHEGQPFWLAGLGDQAAIPVSGGYRGVDDLPKTLAAPSGDSDPAILLAHEPDIFIDVPERVTLTLAGHTHGGQVNLPLIGRPIVPSHYGERFAYGHVVEGGRHMIVSAGLGLSVLPVRFRVPPEIAIVTLTSPSAKERA